jgi:hypothetical protein
MKTVESFVRWKSEAELACQSLLCPTVFARGTQSTKHGREYARYYISPEKSGKRVSANDFLNIRSWATGEREPINPLSRLNRSGTGMESVFEERIRAFSVLLDQLLRGTGRWLFHVTDKSFCWLQLTNQRNSLDLSYKSDESPMCWIEREKRVKGCDVQTMEER